MAELETTETSVPFVGSDTRMTPAEAVQLALRLTPETPPTSVEEAATIAGVPVGVAKRHLAQMRAEIAMLEASRRKRFPIVPVAMALVAIAASVMFVNLRTRHPAPVPSTEVVTPTMPAPVTVPTYPVTISFTNVLAELRLAMVGPYGQVGMTGSNAGRMTYPVAQATTRVLIEQAAKVLRENAKGRAPVTKPFQDSLGKPVTPRMGLAHVSLQLGDGDMIQTYVSAEPSRAQVADLIRRTIGIDYRAQQDAMRLDVPVTAGQSLVPPPGFQILVHGSEVSPISGPKWRFDRLDPDAVCRRLALSIRSAMLSDTNAGPGDGFVVTIQGLRTRKVLQFRRDISDAELLAQLREFREEVALMNKSVVAQVPPRPEVPHAP